ncbi:MAG: hypothetical protein HY067_02105 [Betaproteobacteria bacterium]|nr:hypothetical protein [Betaproteobacteria bacterium]
MFITQFRTLLSVAIFALLLGACSVITPRQATPISEVVNLSKNGQPEQVINRIGSSKTTYALRGSDFGKLAEAGVPPKVLDYLQQAFLNDVDLLTRYWVLGESLGGCVSCYPQPVDLANLAGGGNGMADAQYVARYSTYGKPQGLPDWVTAIPGNINAPGLTIGEIEQMVKDGTPGADIAARIRASRLYDIIGTGGLTKVSTHYVAGLSGSDLAQLHKDGASDEVPDALQQKFLAEYIEFSRIRYQSWGKGSGPMK